MPKFSHCPRPLALPVTSRQRLFDVPFPPVSFPVRFVLPTYPDHVLHTAIVAQLMSFLPQNKFFLWVDWCALAPDHIRCRPPAPRPLDVVWSRATNNLFLIDDSLLSATVAHVRRFTSFATILALAPSELTTRTLTALSFLVVRVTVDTPILVCDQSVVYASDSTSVFYLTGWIVPPAEPAHVTIRVHPSWDSLVPHRRQPLIVDEWMRSLELHPNDDLVLSTTDNMRIGAAYGYTGHRMEPVLCPTDDSFYALNLDPCIATDIEKGFRTGAFPFQDGPPLINAHRYPIKGVTKTFDVKVRLVNAHGAPYDGTDLNSNIDIIATTLFGFQLAIALLLVCGPGTLMFKFDVANAFKVLNLHVQDWHLNGESLPGAWAFSVKPNFGAKSAGSLWDAVGGLAEFIFRSVVSLLLAFQFLVRYCDDYLQLVPPCNDHLFTTLKLFSAVSVKAAALGLTIGKFTYPSTRIVWLGLVLDSVSMTAELTEERRVYLLFHLKLWLTRSWASREEIESFHGHLQFAASIVRHGRFFLGGITALIYADPKRRMIRIGAAAKEDIQWWLHLLSSYTWSGISHLTREPWATDTDVSLEITTDASKLGRGVFFNGSWTSTPWTKAQLEDAFRFTSLSMVYLELFAIVDACATFGPRWKSLRITLQTDSEAVVNAWSSRRAKDCSLRSLFRKICLFMTLYDFDLNIIHIRGKLNIKADLLSRLQVSKFLHQFPEAESFETTTCEWWLHV